jgi:hypothetical protein
MGVNFTDQFSLLHFSTGIIVYFWRLSFNKWFIVHLLYEVFTNTKYGIYFINHYSQFPGGKLNYDSYLNILGDQFWGMLGWIFAYLFVLFFYKGKLDDTYQV